MSRNGICNYCKVDTKLINAHIVPRCFLGDVTQQNFLEASTEYLHTKRRPIGPYDQKILCAKCDGKIGEFDNYAKALLMDNIDQYRNSKHPFYQIPSQSYDYAKLKKFFISLIWRASISSDDMFNRVSLGRYNDIALSHIKGKDPLDDNLFAVLLFKDAPSLKYQNTITFTATKLAGKKSYKVHFAGYQVTIIPKASDMHWNIVNGTTSPAEMFLKDGSDFCILEVDQDLSGKDKILLNYKRSQQALN